MLGDFLVDLDRLARLVGIDQPENVLDCVTDILCFSPNPEFVRFVEDADLYTVVRLELIYL